MDYDLVRAVREAWERVRPELERDAGELAARRARRRMLMMRRAPRAWCLGVRACDTRITPWQFAMVPDRVEWRDESGRVSERVEHTVELDERGLRQLCAPVVIPRPGLTRAEVATLLGVDVRVVDAAMKRGMFSVRRTKGLGGAPGKPVPTLYTPKLLDAAGIAMGRMNDTGWGTLWRYVSDHIPAGLRQTLVRRPVRTRYRDADRSGGWRWVCPGCGRQTRVVYCPVPGPVLLGLDERQEAGSADGLEAMPTCFACTRCHGVHDYGRLNGQGWNDLVMHLSGGLLYGREVERPAWWKVERRRAYRARAGYPKSKREAEITKLLVETTLSCGQIALRLGLARGTVQGWVGRIYARRGVHGREELRGIFDF